LKAINYFERHCQVAEKLYVGSQDAAVNHEGLRAHGVTHVLNVATGVEYPKLEGMVYRTVEILDLPETNIVEYLPQTNEFISQGIAAGGVLVHWFVLFLGSLACFFCLVLLTFHSVFRSSNAGVSRSVSAVIGFLMTTRGMGYQEAFDQVKRVRTAAQPNEGFRKQLLAYEQTLKPKITAEHKLHTPWALWFDKKGSKQTYAEHLRRLGTFDSIEGLWE